MHPKWHYKSTFERDLYSIYRGYYKYFMLVLGVSFLVMPSLAANDILVLPTKSKHHTHKLEHCDSPYTFLTDTLSNHYRDTRTRNTIYTICPQYPQQRVGIHFKSFEVAIGDTLFAYNGYNTEAPLLGFATGEGIQAAFGGNIATPYSRETNPTSCITFLFHTNGDEIAGEGWEAEVQCFERTVSIVLPHIPSQQFDCGPSYALVTIPPAQVFSPSGPVENDSTLLLIRDGQTGLLCGETVLSFTAGHTFPQAFGPGSYVLEYISLLDNTVRGTTRFEVVPPALECKEELLLQVNEDCQLTLNLNQLVENYCPPEPGVFHYNFIIRDQAGNVITTGNTIENSSSLPLDRMALCSDEVFVVEIQKEYADTSSLLPCNSDRLVQSCVSKIKIADQVIPSFLVPAQSYTLAACDFDLLEVVALLPIPSVMGACGIATALFESAINLDNTVACSGQPNFLITWRATDDCGNAIRRVDTLRVIRPSLIEVTPSEDITIFCSTNEDIASITPIYRPALLAGLTINGNFQPMDTLFLATTETICDYQLTLKENISGGNCGKDIIRYWSLVDVCQPSTPIALDTQIIQLIDTIAPTISCTAFSNLDKAEIIPIANNNCQTIVDFPLPTATDDCEEKPIVKEFTVETLVNGGWSPRAISLFQQSFGPGTYRVGYEASDACGNTSNQSICYRYFIIQDKVLPIANCKENILIQLNQNGTASLTAAALNNNSFDNCGISQLLIKRSLCQMGGQLIENPDTINLGNYSDSVSFDCCDVTGGIQVELLVIDGSGNMQRCSTQIDNIASAGQGDFNFTDPTQVYTLTACDFDLLQIISTLPKPAVENDCGQSFAQIETTAILNDDTGCNNQSDFLIVWAATDDFGNTIQRVDTLKIERPSLLQLMPIEDFSVPCEDFLANPDIIPIQPPSLLTGLTINGQFQPLDTIVLSLDEVVCDFQLSFEISANTTNCGDKISRIWSVTDLCISPSETTPLATQLIEIIDTIAPVLQCGNFTSIENAEIINLPSNACQTQLNFSLPVVTDNCDTAPTIRIISVESFQNNTWTVIGNNTATMSLGVGTYRLAYEAVDACGNVSVPSNCYRHFTVKDNTLPIANCKENLTIRLDQNGMATLTATTLNDNSSDNCGISQLLIKRSVCDMGSQITPLSDSININDFSNSVPFDCCDTNGEVQVDLLVVDASGNLQTCSTQIDNIETEEQSGFIFIDPIQTYTLTACDFDLLQILSSLPIPAVTNPCGQSLAQIETTAIINNNTRCNNQSDFLITWAATDDFGNTIRRVDTLKIERPVVVQTLPSNNIPINCEADLSNPEIAPIPAPRLLSGLTINGQFRVLDTIVLSLTEVVCDFQLSLALNTTTTNCGDKVSRVWSIIDLCNEGNIPIPIDTQFLQLLDTIAPILRCSEFASIDNAQTINVATDGCETVLDFPLPIATDNCDSSPIVRESSVEQLVEGNWTNIGTNLSATPLTPGTFRVAYTAIDACGIPTNTSTCYRYMTVVDTVSPIAICQQEITIQLDENGTASLSAEELNNNSFDNCGIEILLTKRSACEDGDQRMEVINDTIIGINLEDWSPSINFECCDLLGEVVLDLLVVDSSNNFNRCRTQTRVIDTVIPECAPLPTTFATCLEYEVTEIGRPTDLNGNNEFDDSEWLPLLPSQSALFNTRFGNALVACIDNASCRLPAVEQQYQLLEGRCGSISIKRRYRAIDESGNTSAWLEQMITVNYQPDWTLVFPADATTNCDITKIEDPVSPVQNGRCDDLVWNFRDSIVRFEDGTIKEICRTFNIVNRCFGNMDNQWLELPRNENEQGVVVNPEVVESINYVAEDHLTYTQKIRLVDTEAPFLVIGEVNEGIIGKGDDLPFGEEDQSLGAPPFECDEIKEFAVFARDCNEPSTAALTFQWEFFRSEELIASGAGSSFQQTVVADSAYTVNWSARDNFGNQTDTTVHYQFRDAGAPVTLCREDVQVTIDVDSRKVNINTDSLNANSFDNCDDQVELGLFMWHETVSVDTPLTIQEILQLPDEIEFTCLDTGDINLLLYATDQNGNFSFCSTTVEVLENPDVDCDETMLSGMVTNRFGHPITGAGIEIIGDEMDVQLASNESGTYLQMLPIHHRYTIRPHFDKHPLNGISTYDIILISKHIIGEQRFDSPYQYIAADVNRSGNITVFDIVQLRQLILNQLPDFPNNDSWRFVNADYQFQTINPLSENFPEYYEYQANNAEHLTKDFIGVKIGDLNGNADTYNLQAPSESRQAGTAFSIYTNSIKIEKGKTYTIPFYTHNLQEITGFQATFKFHDLFLTNFEGGVVTSENIHGWRTEKEGFLTTSWHSLLSHDNNTSLLFSLKVKATKDGTLQEMLTLTSHPTPAEAYSLSGNRLGLDLTFPKTTIKDQQNFGFVSTPLPPTEGNFPKSVPSVSGVFELFQNHPNPFSKTTTISFYLPNAALTALSVFDVHGRNILHTLQHYETGTHTITLNSDQLPIGTYFYQVATPKGVATKKMTIIH